MFYFYMLRCADNSLYCGITNDLEKRVEAHNSKNSKTKYTRAKQPVQLIYSETFKDKSSALKREWEVKKWPKAKKEELVRRGNTA